MRILNGWSWREDRYKGEDEKANSLTEAASSSFDKWLNIEDIDEKFKSWTLGWLEEE